MNWLIRFGPLALLLMLAPAGAAWAEDAEWDFKPRPVARIPGGVVLGETISGWSHPLLTAELRLTAGDTDAVSSTVNYYAEKFNLALLANVRRAGPEDYFLDKVAVGFSTDIGDQQVVITGDTHEKLGAKLGFLGGQVFVGNEATFKDVFQMARYRHGMVIDAPAYMVVDGEHVLRRIRHFIWVSKTTGKLGTLVWMMEAHGDKNYAVLGEAMNLLPPALQESRDLHVDGDEFTFGIPGNKAFAMIRLPPGRAVPLTPELRSAAGVTRFDEPNYLKLLTLVSEAVAAVK